MSHNRINLVVASEEATLLFFNFALSSASSCKGTHRKAATIHFLLLHFLLLNWGH